LTALILAPFMSRNLALNLGFIGFSRSSLLQGFLWAFNIYIYYISPFMIRTQFETTEIYMVLITTIGHIITVSVKYATYSRQKLKDIKSNRCTNSQLRREMALGHWKDQGKLIMYEELFASMLENQVNPELFNIEFFAPLDSESSRRFIQRTEMLGDNNQAEEEEGEKKPYKAWNIVVELIEKYQKKNTLGLKLRLCDLFSLGRACLPLAFYGFPPIEPMKWVLLLIFILVNFRYFATSNYFLVIHSGDLKRKTYFMEQLTYLLAPRKFEGYESKKQFPTIYLLCSKSLKTWNSLRKVCLDYGKVFDQRVQKDTTIKLSFYGIIFMVWYSITISMCVDSLTKKGWLCLVVVVFLEIINIFFMAFIIFVRGTQINEYYTRHKRILMENKILYLDIMRKVDYYFSEDKVVPLNYLYKTMISSLHDVYEKAGESTLVASQSIKNHLKALVSSSDELMEDLDLESILNPFTVFGVKNSKEFVIGLAAMVISLISTVFILLYTNGNKTSIVTADTSISI